MIIRILKKADDPITPTRVSLGSAIHTDGALMGYYCTYRGRKEDAIACMESTLEAMKALPHEPAIAADDGKRFA